MIVKGTILTVIATLLLTSCGSMHHAGKTAEQMPGTWQVQPIVIDGDCKDWPSPYPNYDAKSMVAYATSNDEQNLYITMETGDEMTQLKILKQGMSVYIDTTGKKEPGPFTINYPLPNDNDQVDIAELGEGQRREAQPLNPKKMNQIIGKTAQNANQLSIEGFKDCNGGFVVSQNNGCGIKVKMRIDEYKQLVWEAMIPFKAIYGRSNISAADAGKPVSVCFAVKAFKQVTVKNADNNIGANSSMGGGGMRNGNMRASNGGNRPNESPVQRLYESTKTWKHFGLSWQK